MICFRSIKATPKASWDGQLADLREVRNGDFVRGAANPRLRNDQRCDDRSATESEGRFGGREEREGRGHGPNAVGLGSPSRVADLRSSAGRKEDVGTRSEDRSHFRSKIFTKRLDRSAARLRPGLMGWAFTRLGRVRRRSAGGAHHRQQGTSSMRSILGSKDALR